MSEKLLVPDIGDFDKVEVIELLVKVGDQININDPVVTIESDKSSVEVPSTISGKVDSVNVKVGDKVSKGDLLLNILPSKETPSKKIIPKDTENIIKEAENALEKKIKENIKQEPAERRSIQPLVKIVSWASCGVDPSLMGLGPIPAVNMALKRASWKIEDIDLFEINEAFAAQSIAVIKDLKIPKNIVNVNGGAIALGHPIGASGTRILVTLIHEMTRLNKAKGCATLCIGGGMGIAICVEKN